MLSPADNLMLSADSIRAHKLRAALTVLGLTMGVATLITVMTLVQGANLYVEQKIANLGTNEVGTLHQGHHGDQRDDPGARCQPLRGAEDRQSGHQCRGW